MTNVLFGSVSDPTEWVYHYTSLTTALEKILPSGTIRMGAFSGVNDPRESKAWRFSVSCPTSQPNDDEFFAIQAQATGIVKGNCKVLCTVQDDPRVAVDPWDYAYLRGYARPRMWAQYADNHAGVCLVLDRAALDGEIRAHFGPGATVYAGAVTYSNTHPDDVEAFNIDYDDLCGTSLEDVLARKLSSHYGSYFFRKAEDWQHEIEWRWVACGSDGEPAFISVRDCLRAVVLGVDFPEVYHPSVAALAATYPVNVARLTWANGLPIALPGPYEVEDA